MLSSVHRFFFCTSSLTQKRGTVILAPIFTLKQACLRRKVVPSSWPRSLFHKSLFTQERGAVIEAIVARTLRQVESSQTQIRIVGLSATLPTYKDVAVFLRVNVARDLFYFDSSYRPVPLETCFIGVMGQNINKVKASMNEICYKKVLDRVKQGHQIMVFVHSRKDTAKTARTLLEFAERENTAGVFDTSEHQHFGVQQRIVEKSKNKELRELFAGGFGVHHAGMLRSDRNLTEKLFSMGLIKVLFCTATLAWGVNLPAHSVLIKGTQIYDAKQGKFVELSILDVMQIFGRAGRPQFDTSGEGMILTTHDKLAHYMQLMHAALPIESTLQQALTDHLNAEVPFPLLLHVCPSHPKSQRDRCAYDMQVIWSNMHAHMIQQRSRSRTFSCS